jgi:hypothetical protein
MEEINYYPGINDSEKQCDERDVQAHREAATSWVRTLLAAIQHPMNRSRADEEGAGTSATPNTPARY